MMPTPLLRFAKDHDASYVRPPKSSFIFQICEPSYTSIFGIKIIYTQPN